MSLGATAASAEEEDEAGDSGGGFGTRAVKVGQRVCILLKHTNSINSDRMVAILYCRGSEKVQDHGTGT
jgi:hypothetical protein